MVNDKAKCTLDIDDPDVLQRLIGADDVHLQLLEKTLEISATRVKEGIVLSGLAADVALAENLLNQLVELILNGEKLYSGDVEHSLNLLSGDRKLKLKDIFRDQITISKYTITPKSPNQKNYLDSIRSSELTFGVGPAGTGKTYLATAMALKSLLEKKVKKIVLCRPAVEAGEKLGFLPGDMAEKVNPYLRPLYDALHDMLDLSRVEEMFEKGQIEVAPLAFMRGRTLSNAFVILDEAQNTSIGQMKMLLTRMGRGSKCVVTGDITQIDLPGGVSSGLVHALKILGDISGISMVYLDEKDVVRHSLVAKISAAYEQKKNNSD